MYRKLWMLKIITITAVFVCFVCSFPLSALSQTAKEAFLQGNKYLEEKNYQQAITAYQQTIKLNPYHKIAYHNLGRCYFSLNLFTKAEESFQKALKLDPDYIPAFNKLGIVYEYQKKYKEAWKCYDRVLSINPMEAEAHYNLASLFQKKHDFERAILHAQKAIKTKPDYVEALVKLGDIYWKSYHDMEKASIYYKRAKGIEPENKLVRSCLVEMYMQEGLTEDAEMECLEIVSIDPLSITAMSQLVKIYTSQGRYERIGPLCQQIVSITPADSKMPSYISVLSSMITLLVDQGMEKNASLLSQKLVSISPSSKTFNVYLTTLTNLINSMLDKRRYEQTALFCKRITTLVPPPKELNSYRGTLNHLIRLYFSHKMHSDSIPLCQRTIAISPSDGIAHYQLSIAYKGMGKYKECTDHALKACRIDSFDEMFWHIVEKEILDTNRQQVGTLLRNECAKRHLEMAQHCFRLGNIPLSEYEYKKARQLNPQSVLIRLGLAKCYEEQGMKLELIEELEKVLELDPENNDAKDKLEIMWQQKTSPFIKGIIPEVRKRRVAVIFSAKNPLHLEIDRIAEEMMDEFLTKSLTVSPVPAKEVQAIMSNTGLTTVNDLSTAVQLATNLGANYLLWGKIQEEKERICIESQLLNLKKASPKKEQEFLHVNRNKGCLTKCLSYLSHDLSNFFPVQGEVISLGKTNVILNLGEKHGAKPGFICDAFDSAGKKITEIEIIEVSDNTSKGIVTTVSGMRQLLPHNRVNLRKGQVVKEVKEKKEKKEKKVAP